MRVHLLPQLLEVFGQNQALVAGQCLCLAVPMAGITFPD